MTKDFSGSPPRDPSPAGLAPAASPDPGRPSARVHWGRAPPALFALTLFLSATLLFWSQPLTGKMLLPLLGGAPSVWNLCLVFFQGTLLAGYFYAHLLATRWTWRVQAPLHLLLLAGAAWFLPFGVSESALQRLPSETAPHLWLLGTLFLTAGIPCFVLSATAPLLQKWFARSNHPWAGDPYFLYAASNAGSLAALLLFPVLFEPWLRTQTQAATWAALYGVFALLVAGCAGVVSWSGPPRPRAEAPPTAPLEQIAASRRLHWLVLAFVPSSLMLGVTSYITSDIASAPLLWVIPLALYLLTFVLVFARRSVFPEAFLRRVLPIGAVAIGYLWITEATHPAAVIIPLHLGFFWMAAHYCHGRLAQERPGPARLTEFYLLLSLGGVLGGLFNAILAPLLFTRVIEYPLAIVAATLLLRQAPGINARNPGLGLAAALGLGLLTYFLAAQFSALAHEGSRWVRALIYGAPLVICFLLSSVPTRFALALTAVFLAAWLEVGAHGRVLWAERNFFGIVRVTAEPEGRFIQMVHGNTIHGRQWRDPLRACEPLSYYHFEGPFGAVIEAYQAQSRPGNVAVVGLGAGNMIAYARPGERWIFYEINPAVIHAATAAGFFTFLSGCGEGTVEIVTGDARLQIAKAPDGEFDLIVLDAFSSDAIPVHLLTREALELYLAKLAPEGFLAFHISNRTLNLEPVLADLAGDLGLVCLAQDDMLPTLAEIQDGKEAAHWVVLARRPEHVRTLHRDGRWLRISPRPRPQVWTDDFSNILRAFR